MSSYQSSAPFRSGVRYLERSARRDFGLENAEWAVRQPDARGRLAGRGVARTTNVSGSWSGRTTSGASREVGITLHTTRHHDARSMDVILSDRLTGLYIP